MTKVLILCAHRPNRSPSQRYRFEQYLSFLESQGFSFTFSFLLNEKDDEIFYSKGNFFGKVFILIKSLFLRIKDCFRFNKFQIVFIQREAYFLGTSFFEKQAHMRSHYVIFDLDDSIWLADTSAANLKWEWLKRPQKLFNNIRYADVVLAGNKYLADKCLPYNPNTTLIPTTVDTDIHMPMPDLRNKEILIIGWSGSLTTVKHYELLVPVLIKVKEKFGTKIKFKMIGDKNYKNELLDIEFVEWHEDAEVRELNSFDIGIMPLPDDEWSRGKCGLKALSYMACGVPSILSAVGTNKEIISQGINGFLAESDEDWFNIISRLVADGNLRKEIGNKGRDTVVEKYSVKANAEKYLSAFQKASSGLHASKE